MLATIHPHATPCKQLSPLLREAGSVLTGKSSSRRCFGFLLRGTRTNNLISIEIDDLPRLRAGSFYDFVRHIQFQYATTAVDEKAIEFLLVINNYQQFFMETFITSDKTIV